MDVATAVPEAHPASRADTAPPCGADEPSPSRVCTHQPLPATVNYHLWAACNMRCGFCFAPFQDVIDDVLPRGHLPRAEAITLVRNLAQRFRKVTFVGGEPTLCPWLPDLVRKAKSLGAVTMMVTNGSRLPEVIGDLGGIMDWVTLSIDSASTSTMLQLGRAVLGKKAIARERYLQLGELVRKCGMRLKVNTVVTSVNAGEDMVEFITALRPDRWKVFQVLPVEGQNTGRVDPLLCSGTTFQAFVARHRVVEAAGITLVPEDNEAMRGSYAMVDPAGRFFDNVSGRYRYTEPILEVGVDRAWRDVSFSHDRFTQRGGDYDFGLAPSPMTAPRL